MLRYLHSSVYIKEIPGEITLGIAILGCDVHCPDCHSSHVWDINCGNQGNVINHTELSNLIDSQYLVSCVLFYGGEWKLDALYGLLVFCKENYKQKLALYSGRELSYFKDNKILPYLDYLKVGAYNKQKGGLSSPSTNQKLYTIKDGKVDKDITELFWRSPI